jgi:hypothetical protein
MSRHPDVEHILQFFSYSHLPEHLQKVSRPFYEIAETMALELNDSPELVAGLRKLLEAKDCFVRARICN